jgi:hypothetical protein
MKKLLVFAALAVACAGCVVVRVSDEHRQKIAKYLADGSLAKAKKEIGYTVNPAPTLCWALIPGANKIHIARKIEQSPYCEQFKRDYPVVTAKLLADGWVCAAFSWIPYLYEFTMPCQAGSGVFPDVVRVNNLMWMYHVDSKQ